MDLNSLPTVLCSHRFTTSQRYDLIVVHTNEGPEGPTSAEGLANYLARPNVVPGYHVVVDENSAVRCTPDNQRCNGAGGVNSRAWHICVTGYSAQTSAQWDDPESRAAVTIVDDLVRQASAKLGVPHVRITDSRSPNRGVCGHVDVSRYFSASMGHTDPGPNFPWERLFGATPPPAPTPPAPIPEDDMDFFCTGARPNDKTKVDATFYVSGTSRMWCSPKQVDVIILAAAKQSPEKTIPNIGVVDQATLERWPLVGPAA